MLRFFGKFEESDVILQCRQLLASLCILGATVLNGQTAGYSAVLLPQLRSNSTVDEGFSNLSSDDLSWLTASVTLSMLTGSWIGGFLLEKIGRKWSSVAIQSVTSMGWLVISLAGGFTSLIIGRVICGFSYGLSAPLIPVYLSEISGPTLRGVLLSLISVTMSTGILVIHVLGMFLHWRTTAYICMALSLISWMTCITSQESPTWLLNKGDTARAIELWVYLRGCNSLAEYLALENAATTERKLDNESTLSDLKEALTSRYFLYPLVILSVYFFISEFDGISVLVFYSVDMLTEVTGPDYANLGTVVIDVVRLLASTFTCYFIKRYNRRTLTFVSGVVTASTLFLLSLALYYKVGKPWCPGGLLLIAMVSATIGLTVVPWILCGELFPRKFRGLGSALTTSVYFLSLFAVVKIMPTMIETLKIYGSFATYGIITVFGTIFLYYTLPETKDKVLEDVRKFFDKKADSRNADHSGNPEFYETIYF